MLLGVQSSDINVPIESLFPDLTERWLYLRLGLDFIYTGISANYLL